jgi:hypothetical protein
MLVEWEKGWVTERLYATSQRKGTNERAVAHKASGIKHLCSTFCGRARLSPGADSLHFSAERNEVNCPALLPSHTTKLCVHAKLSSAFFGIDPYYVRQPVN